MMRTNDLAWMKGAAAFEPGDTVDMAKTKAADQGYKPYSEGYAAFITAFSREVRNCQARPEKAVAPATTAVDSFSSGNLAAA